MVNPLLNNVSPSLTLELSARAKALKKEGKDIINLSAGEPDFDTPLFIKEKVKEAIDKGLTKYMPSSGLLELRESISEYLKEQGMDYTPDRIVVSPGAKFAVFAALYSLLDRGDEVIIISPYWVSYPEMAHLCGVIPRIIKTLPQEGYEPDMEKIKKAISSKTKVLILNSPSNPTGKVLSKEFLESFLEMAEAHNMYIISDEIYDQIIFDKREYYHIGSLNPKNSNIIVVNGASKSLSMTGLRLGWSASPKEVTSAIAKLQSHTTSCAVSICQYATAQALRNPERKIFFRFIREEFQKRRDILCRELEDIKEIKFFKPEGAFYVFIDIKSLTDNSLEFCKKFLENAFVASVPGEAFGEKGFIRVSLSEGPERLREAVRRLKEFIRYA